MALLSPPEDPCTALLGPEPLRRQRALPAGLLPQPAAAAGLAGWAAEGESLVTPGDGMQPEAMALMGGQTLSISHHKQDLISSPVTSTEASEGISTARAGGEHAPVK